MTRTDTENWDNYWQGRSSHASGNALVEVGIESEHALKTVWSEYFRAKPTDSRVVDLACGAGSVLSHAHALGFEHLTGVDISPSAVAVMTDKLPGAAGVVSALDDIPLGTSTQDIAVSQFGIEYAGDRDTLARAFQEIHRILKPGGELRIVAHAAGSVIHEGCLASLDAARMVRDSGFTSVASSVIEGLAASSDGRGSAEVQLQLAKLGRAAEPILAWLRGTKRDTDHFAQFIFRMLEGTHRLINRHAAYEPKESLDWIAGMDAEIDAYEGRMVSMTRAALSRGDLDRLMSETARLGATFEWDAPETLSFGADTRVAAWSIGARKTV